MGNFEVIGLGALNMDSLYRVDRILEDGETVVEKVESYPGGSAANTIYGLAKLGLRTGFIGVVGKDSDGKRLVGDFTRVGVDTSQIRLKPGRSGSVVCLSDRSGKRSLYVVPGANNELAREDVDLDYVKQAKMLHISSFANDRQFRVLLELVASLSRFPATRISFAPGAIYTRKGLSNLAPILARTHILFLNRDELCQLGGQDINTGAEACLREGCRIVVVTLGKGIRLGQGTAAAYIRDAAGEYIIEPAPQAKDSVADTTGAGDAFATGFLYGLLNGKGLEECGRLGNIVAQFSIREIGARQGLPTLAELTKRYQELYQKRL